MHLIFLPYGINNKVDFFLGCLQYQFFPWRRLNVATGVWEIVAVQGSLRPTMFGAYEYIFPKESLGELLASLGVNKDINKSIKIKHLDFQKLALRKILKCKNIPKTFININDKEIKIEDAMAQRIITSEGVSLYIIGIREDEVRDNPHFATPTAPKGYRQEML